MPNKPKVKVVKPKTTKKKEAKLYRASMRFNDTVSTVEADTIEEALNLLTPEKIKTRVLFRFEKEGKTAEKLLNIFATRQIFRNKYATKAFVNRLIFK